MISLVQRNSSAQSLRGNPSIQDTTAIGSGAAKRSTKSPSPVAAPVAASSRISTAMRSMIALRSRKEPRVKRLFTTRRIGPCCGGSSITTISDGGKGGAPARRSMMPCALEKRSGCFDTCTMSACFVTAQNGSYPGGSKRATGASARSRVHTACG